MVARVSPRSALKIAQREHNQLHEKLNRLAHLIEKKAVTLEKVVELLKSLRKFFIAHFQKEEQSGLFELIEERAPHLNRVVRKVRGEHVELVQRMDGMLRFARRGTGQPLCWWMLNHRMQDLVVRLKQHESEENGMLQMAYADDLGTKD